jgi:hypothetical protein
MSAVYGVNATKLLTPSASNIIDQSTLHSEVKMMYDEYEASALATASTITMGGKLPVGARILNVILYNDDMGSTVTCDVGDADDADRYLDGVNLTNANDCNSLLIAGTRLGEIDGFGYVIDGDDDDQIVITTAGILTGTLKLIVLYAI